MNRSLTDTFQAVPKSTEARKSKISQVKKYSQHRPIRGSVCTDCFAESNSQIFPENLPIHGFFSVERI